MERKNYLCSLLFTMVIGLLSFGFVSCGGDDEEESSSGSGSGSSVSLVGKTFYKSETSYTEIGEKELDKETISFTTESRCTLRCWGSWENIYSDGSKDKNKYDTGEMSGYYSISGVTVSVRIPGNEGYDREYTIVDGGLLGFKQIED